MIEHPITLNNTLNDSLNDPLNEVHIDINNDTEEETFLFKLCLNKKYKLCNNKLSIFDIYCKFIGIYTIFMGCFFILVVTPYIDWNKNTKIFSFFSVMLLGLLLNFLACYVHNKGKNKINFRCF